MDGKQQSAVGKDGLSGHIGSGAGREEQRDARDFVRAGGARGDDPDGAARPSCWRRSAPAPRGVSETLM